MPEKPWFKCFPQDALSDQAVLRCSEAARGIWFFAWFTMKQSGDYKLEGPADELARVCRTSETLLYAAIEEWKRTKTAEIAIQNGCIKIVCRRLLREHKISEIRREAVNKRWNKFDTTPNTNGDTNEHTNSASASASVSVPLGKEGTGEKGKKETVAEWDIFAFQKKVSTYYGRPVEDRWEYVEDEQSARIFSRSAHREELAIILRHRDQLKEIDRRFYAPSVLKLLERWTEWVDQARAAAKSNGAPRQITGNF